jgi:hypothetical protein
MTALAGGQDTAPAYEDIHVVKDCASGLLVT